MAEFKKPTNEQEFDKNFTQLKPYMNSTEAHYESSRCLYCYDAPCITACPTGIDIPKFIRQINASNAIGAAKTIYESNVLGYSCGKVCPTEVLCEGACVYNLQDVKPIEIGRLQTYATGKAIDSDKKLFELKPNNGKKVAVIGAGPAGIAAACELRKEGFAVDIFEANAKPSGLTVYGVAPYKITNDEALNEMDYLIKQYDLNITYNNPINSKSQIDEIEAKYDAIFLGIGLGLTSDLGINGENLENCVGAVEFVADLRMNHSNLTIPKKVIVLGGGNTAMDAASESARMGADEVILAYRRSKEAMGAYEFEYDLAKSVGVRGMFNVSPLEIVGNGKVSGVKFIRTEEKDGQLSTIPNSEFVIDCDWVLKATGQSKQKQFLGMIQGLEMDKKGCIVVNDNFQTTNSKYYAAGDNVSGGQEVVNAVANGKIAAIAIKNNLV